MKYWNGYQWKSHDDASDTDDLYSPDCRILTDDEYARILKDNHEAS